MRYDDCLPDSSDISMHGYLMDSGSQNQSRYQRVTWFACLNPTSCCFSLLLLLLLLALGILECLNLKYWLLPWRIAQELIQRILFGQRIIWLLVQWYLKIHGTNLSFDVLRCGFALRGYAHFLFSSFWSHPLFISFIAFSSYMRYPVASALALLVIPSLQWMS